MKPAREGPRKWFGLLRRKEVWALTWRARLLVLLLLAGGAWGLVRGIHGFLALDSRSQAAVLVVEGWVPEYALTNFIRRENQYERIYTIGGPTLTDRQSRDDSDTYASVCMKRLWKAGVPPEKIQMVPCWISRRDRTFASFVALREWSRTNGVTLNRFDVATMGVHARRSRMLAQKAFPGASVGTIPILNEYYEPEEWWRRSEGVKEVFSETLAYLYARLFFSPD